MFSFKLWSMWYLSKLNQEKQKNNAFISETFTKKIMFTKTNLEVVT